MWTVAKYVLKQKLLGRKRYPLVLMLEPLFRCNLACAGCGKIQYPAQILRQQLTPEQCFNAADECGAPMVSIPGGEPLLHPQINQIVEGLIARGKYVYLCTNALLLKKKLDLFVPSKFLTFSVHLDGQREQHDRSVCREGGYDIAVDAMREALASNPAFAMRWVAMLNAELRRLRLQCERLALTRVQDRVLHLLETEGERGRYAVPSGLKSLAGELGVTHEALYRALAALEKAGRLSREEGCLLLLRR
jgi:hopanoid biosynthesis associated radical SAM protein HpnH